VQLLVKAELGHDLSGNHQDDRSDQNTAQAIDSHANNHGKQSGHRMQAQGIAKDRRLNKAPDD